MVHWLVVCLGFLLLLIDVDFRCATGVLYVPTGDQVLVRDQCLRGISAYGGSVPTGDQCLRGISAYGGSVPTGDQCLRGISA
jgi:hypothetical protein